MNIITLLRTQFDLIRSGLFNRAGTLADLLGDASRLRARALLISERNQERANALENERARLEKEIERLDNETDEADLIAVVASRCLLGE